MEKDEEIGKIFLGRRFANQMKKIIIIIIKSKNMGLGRVR